MSQHEMLQELLRLEWINRCSIGSMCPYCGWIKRDVTPDGWPAGKNGEHDFDCKIHEFIKLAKEGNLYEEQYNILMKELNR